MKIESRFFWQGWALCTAFIVDGHDQPSMIKDAIKEYGLTLKILKDAEIDKFDMQILRKLF